MDAAHIGAIIVRWFYDGASSDKCETFDDIYTYKCMAAYRRDADSAGRRPSCIRKTPLNAIPKVVSNRGLSSLHLVQIAFNVCLGFECANALLCEVHPC